MHLRRALLLFAIVLGLAAVAASVSRPRNEGSERSAPPSAESERPPTVSAGPAPASQPRSELDLDAAAGDTRRLEAGQAATLLVSADEPGQVEIPEMGLSTTAEPLTPARFDIFASEPGRYSIYFTPASAEARTPAGTLVLTTPEP
jgi:hypothetical protein